MSCLTLSQKKKKRKKVMSYPVAEPGFQFKGGKIKREKIESKITLKNSNSILITNK